MSLMRLHRQNRPRLRPKNRPRLRRSRPHQSRATPAAATPHRAHKQHSEQHPAPISMDVNKTPDVIQARPAVPSPATPLAVPRPGWVPESCR